MNDKDILIKKDYDNFKKNENILSTKMDSNSFFNYMSKYGFSHDRISRLIDGAVYTFDEQNEFNIAIRRISTHYDIGIIECVLFIEAGIPMQKVLRFLDGETSWVLKCELSERYSIPMKKSNIFDIMT